MSDKARGHDWMTMKPKVYIETSVIGYLTGRPSRDVVIAGRQEVTREIWPLLTEQFDCYISPWCGRRSNAAIPPQPAIDSRR